MKDGKSTFNVLESIKKHIEALKPLLPKQAIVCIGEYPIKILLKDQETSQDAMPILIEKSSNEIYKWLPKGYSPNFVLDFEDKHIDTHFWFDVLPAILKDNSVIESLTKKSTEKLHGVIFFSSIWDGIGSATLPALINKSKAANIDSLSIAVLPSKIQPTDAHFNALAALEMCLAIEGATVLLLDRDQVEAYEGVDRKGEQIKGNIVTNYLLNLFLAKESLVEEIAELSRTFNTKLFAPIVVTGASYRIYASLENMLNTALLKPLLTFDLSSASLLYVVLRIPWNLKDKLPRGKIELEITKWFKEKTILQSIYITEPIYTQDMSDRIDAVLLVGGYDTTKMRSDLETKVKSLKDQAVERGAMTEDWHLKFKIEEPEVQEIDNLEVLSTVSQAPPANVEEPKILTKASATKGTENTYTLEISSNEMKTQELPAVVVEVPKIVEKVQVPLESTIVSEESKTSKPKRARGTKKLSANKKEKMEKVDQQKEQTSA